MYFKRLDMQGFKSFAEPVTIEFNQGVTCVVGPNGSGKSNISDAIRWVLGEQSPKALRGGKMDEVIFAGTASRKSRGMAEVTLTIDNSDSSLPIDYNEVAITRRMYRSGESEYLINNNHCRLKDIRELIMDTGIGVDGYSLIGQGKIADIVANKTESRREIFEEAAGVVMYRTKKAEAERKLASANQNLERVNDIVAEIEGRIGGLKDDSIKASEYVELRDKYKTLEINITLKNIENLELKNEYLKDDILEVNSEIEEIKESKVEIDAAVQESRKRTETIEELLAEENKKLLDGIEEINNLVNKSQLTGERLMSINQNTERLLQEIDGAEAKLEQEKNNETQLLKTEQELKHKLTALEAELQEKIQNHAKLAGESAERTTRIDSLKNEIFAVHNGNAAKKAEITSLENLKVTLDKRKETVSADLADSERENQDIKKNIENIKAEGAELMEKLQAAEKNLKTIKDAQVQIDSEERQIAKELEETKLAIGQKTARKKTIEEMESNYEGYNHAVRYIMRSGLSGIHGVVAELMKVPSGYEVAIETALGATMQNVVCQNDRNAQTAVKALKESRSGRLTFLPVESIRGRSAQDKDIEGAKGFLGYGTDCIEFDEKYSNIFSYLLGKVALADNMENAIAMSKKSDRGFRIVTLEGEIINASGAITGGSYKNNTANLLERKSEITKLSKDTDDLKLLLEKCTEKLEKLRDEAEEARAKEEKLSEEKRTLEIDAVARKNQLDILESVIKDNGEAKEKLRRELESIDTEKISADNMIEKLQQEMESAGEKAAAIEKETEELLSLHENSKQGLEDAGEEITNARIALTAANGEKSTLEQMLSRVREQTEILSSEITTKTEQREVLLKQREELTGGNVDMDAMLKEKEDRKAALESYIAELTEEKQNIAGGLFKDSAKKDEYDEKLQTLQNSKFEMEIKQGKNETQLENYKEKLWSDFEVSYVQAMEFKKKDFNMATAEREARSIRSRMKELGEVNIGAIKEYASVSERYEFLTSQRKDILDSSAALTKIISEMDKTITDRFKESFDAVVVNFESIFKELFGGGHAELRLDNESNPLESGIDIIAQPPGKKLQNINLLSGGEKTMTAIALMFAVLKTKPTPFCILDEVEAALDDANIDRFANYLKEFDDIQFALVTHQKATMEHADVLYGVTMPEHGISKVISLKLGDEFDLGD